VLVAPRGPAGTSMEGPDVTNSTRRVLLLGEALDHAVDLLSSTWTSSGQALRVQRILERFIVFAQATGGTSRADAITPSLAAAFVTARMPDGQPASEGLLHFRRSSLRLFYRSLRVSGFDVGDPTLDLRLPPRSQLATRPLSDDEVTLCRGHALWSLTDLRRASAWALAEATCRSVEVAAIRVRDIDLDGPRVWITGGRTTADRWGLLSDWGAARLAARVGQLKDPDARVVYGGSGPAATGQISASVALSDVLTRAGLGDEPDVRPASIAAWAGRRILDETGRIDEVARRLGMSSLDRTARFIGWDWRTDS
jgi:integrase